MRNVTRTVLFLLPLFPGCGIVPDLPQSLDVATSATEKSEAAAGSGPATFANSTWSLARLPDPDGAGNNDGGGSAPSGPYGGLLNGDALDRPPVGERIFLIEFGDVGQMAHVSQNRFFLPNFYGDDLSISSQWHATTLPGVAYHSASYGLEAGGRFGVAVVVHVRFGSFFLGSATLYSWGTVSDASMTGTFGYLLDFTDGIVRGLGTIADQYPVEGERIAPQ